MTMVEHHKFEFFSMNILGYSDNCFIPTVAYGNEDSSFQARNSIYWNEQNQLGFTGTFSCHSTPTVLTGIGEIPTGVKSLSAWF